MKMICNLNPVRIFLISKIDFQELMSVIHAEKHLTKKKRSGNDKRFAAPLHFTKIFNANSNFSFTLTGSINCCWHWGAFQMQFHGRIMRSFALTRNMCVWMLRKWKDEFVARGSLLAWPVVALTASFSGNCDRFCSCTRSLGLKSIE